MSGSDLIDDYLAGAEWLREVLAGLKSEDLRARPSDGTWTIQEILCHLADSEALFAERIKRVLAEERPTLAFADPDRFMAALACHEREAEDEVTLICLMRRQIAHILRTQPSTCWSRVGWHSKDGERTLEQVMLKAIAHLEHHLQFLRAKRDALKDATG